MKKAGLLLLAAALGVLPGLLRAEDNDRIQFGQDIVVEAPSLEADLICFFCSVRLRGSLRGDVITIGGGIEIDGTVDGDAVATGGGIRLAAGSKVTGEAVAAGGPIERGAQATVAGGTEEFVWFYLPGQRQFFLPAFAIYLGAMLALTGLIALILRAHRVEAMAAAIRQHPALTILTGCVVFTVAVVLLTFSNYLGKAQPVLATIVSLAMMLTAVVGYAGVEFLLGSRLPRAKGLLAAVLAGAMVVALLQAIPIAGALVFCVFFVLALGCAALSGFGSAPRWLASQFAGRRPAVPAAPTGPGHISP